MAPSHQNLGDALRALGKLAEALQHYRDSVAIFERMANADAANSGRQGDLAFSYASVAIVLTEQGTLAAALQASHDSLTIRERLAKSDPSNALWQDALATARENLARFPSADIASARHRNDGLSNLARARRVGRDREPVTPEQAAVTNSGGVLRGCLTEKIAGKNRRVLSHDEICA
jgi:tetratricopeptide (TPR) repeat protein